MSDQHEFRQLQLDDTVYETLFTRKFARRTPYQPVDPRQVRARIPAVVVSVSAQPGRRVRRGDALLVLEAMKMRNEVTAHHDGVVARVLVAPGQLVAKNELLVELE
ncbi:MAG TPA: acetyl-CoA carboxylase biotin carboxyl carrier protein subunit [Thermoanaerobaculaceae bacterium]|nr:acetyl-CoA carboxylase biotin carboxyl carrier protein subunit [Thermoanaerobaculaceae bacterium]HRS16704.1 acetyl-CoA carboxylase biotin carboxyl carrier protein subunit [Thermoanaerobaculaceae bacterium]